MILDLGLLPVHRPAGQGGVIVRHDFSKCSVTIHRASIERFGSCEWLGYLNYSMGQDSASITLLGVFHRHRGRGYSKVLLNSALAHFQAVGITQVGLYSYPLDEVEDDAFQEARLLGLYEQYGFREEHTPL
jgi:GNAT superfamily N-acetyltransferase